MVRMSAALASALESALPFDSIGGGGDSEELGSQNDLSPSCYLSCTRFIYSLLFNSVADKLPVPLRSIAYSPFASIGLLALLYLLFIVIFLPLSILSRYISPIGAIALFLLGLYLLSTYIASYISFPGSTTSLQSDIAKDYLRKLLTQVDTMASNISSFSSMLSLAVNGHLGKNEIGKLIRFSKEISRSSDYIKEISGWIKFANDELVRYQIVSSTSAELDQFKKFQESLESICISMKEISPMVTEYFEASTSKSSGLPKVPPKLAIDSSARKPSNISKSQLIATAGKCVTLSDQIRNQIAELIPASNNDRPPSFDAGSVISRLVCRKVGPEKLSFPIMRAILFTRMKGIRLRIDGSSGQRLDGVILPSSCFLQLHATSPTFVSPRRTTMMTDPALLQTPPSMQSHGVPSTGSSTTRKNDSSEFCQSQKGIVIFCGPNAALYECLCMANPDSSWLGFYCSLGYDFCFVNYRGYNLSEGRPTPSSIKSDADLVMKYILDHYSYPKIIVHGESIGGMIGCHIAANHKVDLLVCDRTFASLDAVASRLMAPSFGNALRYLAFWQTNVVTDYLAVKCKKIILQDPIDEIIAYSGSLLNGVSSHFVFKDDSWRIQYLPTEYNLSYYLSSSTLPNRDKEMLWIEALDDSSKELSSEFVDHFVASLRQIFLASYFEQRFQSKAKCGDGFGRAVFNSPRSSMSSSHSVSSSTANSSSSSGVDAPDLDCDVEMSLYTSPMQALDALSAATSNNSLSSSKDCSPITSTASFTLLDPASHSSHPWVEWFGQFCDQDVGIKVVNSSRDEHVGVESIKKEINYAIDIQPDTIGFFSSLWVVIARIQGGFGQILGSSLRMKFSPPLVNFTGQEKDSVRSWIASLLVWSPHVLGGMDFALPEGCTTLDEGIEQLEMLLKEGRHYRQQLEQSGNGKLDENVMFCSENTPNFTAMPLGLSSSNNRFENFRSISKYSHHWRSQLQLDVSPLSSANENAYLFVDLDGVLDRAEFILRSLQGLQRRLRALQNHSLLLVQKDDLKDLKAGGSSYEGKENEGSQDSDIGQVFPVHDGHNGWLSSHEVATLRAFLEELFDNQMV